MGLAINERISILVHIAIIVLGIVILLLSIGTSLMIGGLAGKSKKLQKAGLIVFGVGVLIIAAIVIVLLFSS